MTDTDQAPIDGRVARRQRNRDAVLDVVLEMFGEDMMFPTIEQASQRSGLSLRSLYRYFADVGELIEAAIDRGRQQAGELAHLHHVGEGPFDDRLAEFVAMRLRLHSARSPIFRATVHHAATHARVRDVLRDSRRQLREQFELQFGPELAALSPRDRPSVIEAGDLLSQLDSIDILRRVRGLTVGETDTVLRDSLTALLTPSG